MRSCSQLLRRTLIGGLLSWSFGVGQAVAEVQMDGHQLAQMCQNSNSSNHEYCDGFIVGVLHHAQASGDLCSLPENVIPTHRSLFDGSLQGIELRDAPAFGFQAVAIPVVASSAAIELRGCPPMLAKPPAA